MRTPLSFIFALGVFLSLSAQSFADLPSMRLSLLDQSQCSKALSDFKSQSYILVLDQTPALISRSRDAVDRGFPFFDGAFAFRHMRTEKFSGSSQPTKEGFENIIRQLLHRAPEQKVLWVNLRAEPMIYIRGEPFSVRSIDLVSANMKLHAGKANLNDIENAIRKQLIERIRFNQKIDVALDGEQMKVGEYDHLEESDVQTSSQLFHSFEQKNPRLSVKRIEWLDREIPEPSEMDELIATIKPYLDSAIHFQCHYGRGRTGISLISSLILKKFSRPYSGGLGPEFSEINPVQVAGVRANPEVAQAITKLQLTRGELSRLDQILKENVYPIDYLEELSLDRDFGAMIERPLNNYLRFLHFARYASTGYVQGLSFAEWSLQNGN